MLSEVNKMATINYLNPVHLAVAIEGQLAVDRPNALICPTSNPGEASQHYVALALRVYSDKNDLKSFKGYITFRYKEVRFSKKTEKLPPFSSIELLDDEFRSFTPPKKIHFRPDKVAFDDTHLHNACMAACSDPSGNVDAKAFEQLLAKECLRKAYLAIRDMIDGK